MKKVSEYRQHAAECRALAAAMLNREQRDQLLAMADTWDELAEERQRKVQLLSHLGVAPDPTALVDDTASEKAPVTQP